MNLLERNLIGGLLENALRGFADAAYIPKTNNSCRGLEVKLMGTAFLFQQARYMAILATALGEQEAALHYSSLANSTYAYFNDNFYSVETGTYVCSPQ